MINCLTVIPARGGSKGIPRKNVRLLAGKPLIYYSIRTALALPFQQDVYVTSDDDEILTLSAKYGAKIHQRRPAISDDEATLDDVVLEVVHEVTHKTGQKYDFIITMQPTSPLLQVATIVRGIKRIVKDDRLDTVLSATEDRHLSWEVMDGHFTPLYQERVNRQYLPEQYRETGGFVISRTATLKHNTRISGNVSLLPVKGRQSIDIDNYEDWAVCEYYLRCKKIAFLVSGFDEIGLGHISNTLSIANAIVNHEIQFIVCDKSALGLSVIRSNNYNAIMAEGDFLDTVRQYGPDIIINDRLNSSEAYMLGLKEIARRVVSIEDVGPGASYADVVINAMYPERKVLPNHYYGHRYFCLREEFLASSPRVTTPSRVTKLLISFGGTDPNNFTRRIFRLLHPYCRAYGIHIKIILGLGYDKDALKDIAALPGLTVLHHVKDMSTHMQEADLAITSAGRTTFELASVGTPGMVLCQNYRETTHFFANPEYGFINLGLGEQVSDTEILETFQRLVTDWQWREQLLRHMLSADVRPGKENVVRLIQEQIIQTKEASQLPVSV